MKNRLKNRFNYWLANDFKQDDLQIVKYGHLYYLFIRNKKILYLDKKMLESIKKKIDKALE